jgi:hypothetical protein
VPLLVLTAVDYALWDWSIADGHDIVSLVAGLTLLPLAIVTAGGLALAGARLLALLLGRGGASRRTLAGAAPRARGAATEKQPAHATRANPDAPSGRLAA